MNPVVMVVDDDRGIENLLSVMLKINGYHPITAPNGYVALNMLNSCPLPVLILTDYSMPALNGCEFIESLSHRSHLTNIPVVIITGSDVDEIKLPKTNNYKGLIKKPFKIGAVLEKIKLLTAAEDTTSSTYPSLKRELS